MAFDSWSTTNVWESALVAYLYTFDSLEQIVDHQDGIRKWTEYVFGGVNSEDVKMDIEKYKSDEGMPLASAKDFVTAFNKITQTQKNFRNRGETQWVSRRWIEGK